jgi:hypothetical protein
MTTVSLLYQNFPGSPAHLIGIYASREDANRAVEIHRNGYHPPAPPWHYFIQEKPVMTEPETVLDRLARQVANRAEGKKER